jgi:2-phosphoglycerate kinase
MMIESHRDLRVILIGGSSSVGKSTLAESLASHLGWSYRSTDKGLAPHPGRPWQVPPKTVPEHVADHYLSLSVDELITDVLRHYGDNVWPLIEDIVTSHATDLSADKLVMEGSAILPELVVTLNLSNVAAIWLTASNELFGQRIYNASQYETKSPREKKMIDKFLERTYLYNERMMDAVNRLGLVSMDVENASTLDELTDKCLAVLKKQHLKTPNKPDAGDGK